MKSKMEDNLMRTGVELGEVAIAMLENAPMGCILLDENYELTYVNRRAYELFGFDDELEFAALWIKKQFSTDYAKEQIDQAQKKGQAKIVLACYSTKGEATFSISCAKTVIRKDDYFVVYLGAKEADVGSVSDGVYSEAEVEKDLQEDIRIFESKKQMEAKLWKMLNAAPLLVTMYDSEFKPIIVNWISKKLFKIDQRLEFLEDYQKFLPEFQPDGTHSVTKSNELMAKAFEEGHLDFEFTYQDINGTPIPTHEHITRVSVGDEDMLIAFTRDLTEEVTMTKDLKAAMEEAKAADNAKTGFLRTMSHEIRTPLNVIMGIAEIQLMNQDIDYNYKSAFEHIYSSGDLLLSIINNILDLSKIGAGKMEILNYRYEIASLVSDTAQLNMMMIGSKQLEFEVHVDKKMPSYMMGDEIRIKQILNNILSNAINYSESGLVKLSVSSKKAEDSDKVMIELSVSDTGQGMTKEELKALFDPYKRFNVEANYNIEGVGLGMHITKNLVDLMGGTIHVESKPRKGSVFTVTLPQGKVDCAPVGKEVSDNLSKFRTSHRASLKRTKISRDPMPYGRVLIVDDMETNILVARGLLQPYKLTVESSTSGKFALELVESGKEYDIVFMDHMMPEMDGIETAKNLRKMGYTKPIVALTANAVVGQAQMFLDNGFDDFISKPIDIRNLNMILNKLVRDKHPPEVVEAARKQALKEAKAMRQAGVDSLSAADAKRSQIDPQIAEIASSDIKKSLAVLEAMVKNGGPSDKVELRTFTIHVHGMKSAVANVGEFGLSTVAGKLEQLGGNGDIQAIKTEAPEFIFSLKSLQSRLESIAPVTEAVDDSPEYTDLLIRMLMEIGDACSEGDIDTAEERIGDLGDMRWSAEVNELINNISELMLNGDFSEIVTVVNDYTKK